MQPIPRKTPRITLARHDDVSESYVVMDSTMEMCLYEFTCDFGYGSEAGARSGVHKCDRP